MRSLPIIALVALMAAPALGATPDFKIRHAKALDLALAGKTKNAITELNKLAEDSRLPADEKDRVFLSIGRINYQDGFDEAAIVAYKKVRRGSSSWLESLAERAWAELRSGQSETAIATLKTVLSPVFKAEVDSEPYFTMGLAQLRVCDFRSMYKTIDGFKANFRPKIASWEGATDANSKKMLRETSNTIQKLNLVEAEAIQHLSLSESGKRQKGSVPTIVRADDELSFPEVEGGEPEVWMEELDLNRVRTKGCPAARAFEPKATQIASKREKSL